MYVFYCVVIFFFFFKQKTAYEMRISDWSSDVCSSDLIIRAIGAMDADVISIETARSRMELLEAFTTYEYPNEIGPGVYDIHSPRIPAEREMTDLLALAGKQLPPAQIWVNPDCGLKTRQWDEVRPALIAMVAAAHKMRIKGAYDAK